MKLKRTQCWILWVGILNFHWLKWKPWVMKWSVGCVSWLLIIRCVLKKERDADCSVFLSNSPDCLRNAQPIQYSNGYLASTKLVWQKTLTSLLPVKYISCSNATWEHFLNRCFIDSSDKDPILSLFVYSECWQAFISARQLIKTNKLVWDRTPWAQSYYVSLSLHIRCTGSKLSI